MSLGEKIRSGTKWLLVGSVGTQVLQFIFGIALARLLVPADFGMLVTVQIFTGIAGFIAGGGLGQALIQAKEVKLIHQKVVFTAQLTIALLIFSFFYFIAPWFAQWFGDPLYENLLKVSAVSFLLRPFSNLPSTLLKREMKFKPVAIINFVTLALSGIMSIGMAYFGFGVWSLVISGLVASTAGIFLFCVVAKWRPSLGYDVDIMKTLGGYGIKMSVNEIIVHIRNQSANLIISKLSGTTALGLFNKADSLSVLPAKTISGSAYQTIFRALSTTQDNLDTSKYIYFRTITLVTTYAWPFYVGLLWLAQPFVEVVYGENWSVAGELLQILAITGFFRCVANPSGAVIAAQNKLFEELKIQIYSWVILVAGCLFAIQWGLIAVAIVIVIVFLFLSLKLSSLAVNCIGASRKNLLDALKPAITLNFLLFVCLWILDVTYFYQFYEDLKWVYLLGMSLAGSLFYVILFLFLPIASLSAEAKRWRKVFRLSTTSLLWLRM